MKRMQILSGALLLLALAALPCSAQVGKAFTYQGQLTDAGSPLTGTFDLEFRLYSASVGGVQVGVTVTVSDLVVTHGLVTTRLDFGDVFSGAARWLEIRVRPGSSVGAYTTLSPRQELTATPHASALALPVTQSLASSSTLLGITNSGTGAAGLFQTTNSANVVSALFAGNNGPAAAFAAQALHADGAAVLGTNGALNASGKLGSKFTTTIGGATVFSGGVVGTSTQIGGYLATTSSGFAGLVCESATWNAVAGVTSSGHGVWAQSTTEDGAGLLAIGSGISTTSQGTAIEISGGGLAVPGAGLNSMTPVFIHQATAANISGAVSYIDHPLTNGRPGAILIVTQNWSTGTTYNAHPIGLFYSTTSSKWSVFNEDLATMPAGASFNVLVFNNTGSPVLKAGASAASSE